MTEEQKKIARIIVACLLAALGALASALGLTSCNVTRVVTTKSEFMQRGDTSVVIQTKTTETYDGSIKYHQLNM